MNYEHSSFASIEKHVAEILACGAPRDEKARAIAAEIHAAGNYRWVGIYDVTPSEVRIVGFSGPGAPSYPSFPRERGLTGQALRTKSIVMVGDVTKDPNYLTAFSTTRSEMIVPVQVGDAIAGTIDVESEHINAFGEADRQALERVAAAVAPLFAI